MDTDDGPVVDAGWLEREVAEANRLLGPHGVCLAVAERASLLARHAELENAADRDALAAMRTGGVINVFVVRSVRDVDDPSRFIRGVRWRWLPNTVKDYVILSSAASPTTLAHELGHLLGLDHSAVVDNVMSYRRLDPQKVAFDDKQGEKMLRTARLRVSGAQIVPLDPADPRARCRCAARE